MIYTWKDLRDFESVLEGECGSLWRWFDSDNGKMQFKMYSEDRVLMRQALDWTGAIEGGLYFRVNDAVLVSFEVIIPRRLVRRALKLLKIDFRKDRSRIESGKLANSNLKSFSAWHCQKTTPHTEEI